MAVYIKRVAESNEELFKKRMVFYDTETTGLTSDDRIIQIAAIAVEFDEKNNFQFTDCYNVMINPVNENGEVRQIHEEAKRITGIDNKMLEGKPLFKDVCASFLDYLNPPNTLAIAHNAKFDEGMFAGEFKLLKEPVFNNRPVKELSDVVETFDSIDWLKVFESGNQANLDAFASRFFATQPKNVYHVKNVMTGKEEVIDFGLRAVTKQAKEEAKKDKSIENRHDALVDCALLAFVVCSRFKKNWDVSKVKDWEKLNAGIEFKPLNITSKPVKASSIEPDKTIEQDLAELIWQRATKDVGLKIS